ncbi:hypothetical protein ACYULU_13710 [Breznakiellaceae bacterium SP9]
MRKVLVGMAAMALSFGMVLSACVSLEDRTMSYAERSSAESIGSVSTEFTTWQWLHIPNKTAIAKKAYSELKKVAEQRYGGNVEVQNITVSGGFSPLSTINIGLGIGLVGIGAFTDFSYTNYDEYGNSYTTSDGSGTNTAFLGAGLLSILIGNAQSVIATGDVVKIDAEARAVQLVQSQMRKIMLSISNQLMKDMPQRSKIAVLSISSNDRSLSETAVNELEINLFNTRQFTLIERARIDEIRGGTKPSGFWLC